MKSIKDTIYESLTFPGKAFLLTVWEKPYQSGNTLREYKKYPEYNSLMDAWEFQYTSGKGGVNFIAATILNTLHKEYEGVFDENTKVLSKIENIKLDNYKDLKDAPLRVVVIQNLIDIVSTSILLMILWTTTSTDN